MTWLSSVVPLLRMGENISVILLGIVWARKIKFSPAFQPFVYYLAGDAFLYILGAFARKVLHNNIFIFHLSTFSDVVWLSIVFIHLASNKAKPWLRGSLLVFVAVAFASAFWLDGLLLNINITSRFFGNIFLCFMALRQLSQMFHNNYFIHPFKTPEFVFSIAILIYYSCSLLVIVGQDLLRYEWFRNLNPALTEAELGRFVLLPYPLLRAIQFGLLLHLITLFPMGVTPRHALPRWLRFRLGWRPPTKNWRYRVLPPHLVG
ncbi:hypothetical protein [Hymenobacter aerophilus]|uniref:hypothetical protein n=1 Tax=Hymenobacter aerophilus TaxID=119644 RepID=UPI0012FB3A99|nr:hypothetical protein [Hymenobacter aerophilus]